MAMTEHLNVFFNLKEPFFWRRKMIFARKEIAHDCLGVPIAEPAAGHKVVG